MNERYEPPSDFLQACIAEEVPLTGSAFAEKNLARLIAMTRDQEVANRDWATFLLAQTEVDTPEIRAAFVERLNDANEDVRLEALVGLAKRDPSQAKPLVATLLQGDWISDPVIEAAAYCADPELLPILCEISDNCENAGVGESTKTALSEAIDSCTTAIQPQWRDFDD